MSQGAAPSSTVVRSPPRRPAYALAASPAMRIPRHTSRLAPQRTVSGRGPTIRIPPLHFRRIRASTAPVGGRAASTPPPAEGHAVAADPGLEYDPAEEADDQVEEILDDDDAPRGPIFVMEEEEDDIEMLGPEGHEAEPWNQGKHAENPRSSTKSNDRPEHEEDELPAAPGALAIADLLNARPANTALGATAPWPKIHGSNFDWMFDNQKTLQVEIWGRYRGEGAILVTLGRAACTDDDLTYATNLKEAVDDFLDFDGSIIVTPDADNPQAEPPRSFMVRGITPAHNNQLFNKQVISTAKVSFAILSTRPDATRFLGLWFGLEKLLDHTPEGVLQAFRGALNTPDIHREMRRLVREDKTDPRKPRWILHTEDRAMESLVARASIEITKILGARGVEVNVVALYLDSPTSDKEKWKHFRSYLRHALRLGSDDSGTMTFLDKTLRCIICNGGDHPTERCRFPEHEGWNGPDRSAFKSIQRHNPATGEGEPTASHRGNATRGGRGGRGRGGRGAGGSDTGRGGRGTNGQLGGRGGRGRGRGYGGFRHEYPTT